MQSRLALAGLALLLLVAGCNGQRRPEYTLSDRQWLQTYGWNVVAEVAAHRVVLPDRLADAPGAFPVGFYWAYTGELTRSLGPGFDLALYAGQPITARMYRVAETLPDGHPIPELRAVVLRHRGRLIGGYLDRLGHYGFAASLEGKRFPEVVGQPLGTWATRAGVVDWGHPAYRELAGLPPEAVIREFYQALDRHRYDRAYALLSLDHRAWYLFANRDREWLYNPGFRHQPEGLENIRGATVLAVGPPRDITGEVNGRPELSRSPHQVLQFGVSLDLEVARQVTFASGRTHRFVSLARETPDAPWLIDGIGTGP